MSATTGIIVDEYSSIAGTGKLSANVTNHGVIGIGNVVGESNRIGLLTISGSLTLSATSTLKFDILNDSSFDVLNVTGSLSFTGTLAVEFLNQYQPVPPKLFQIINYGSWAGVFVSYVLPTIFPSGHWQQQYNATCFVLLVVPN